MQCNDAQCDDNKLNEVKNGPAVSSSFMKISHITAIGWAKTQRMIGTILECHTIMMGS